MMLELQADARWIEVKRIQRFDEEEHRETLWKVVIV